jgi:hypothetical protein
MSGSGQMSFFEVHQVIEGEASKNDEMSRVRVEGILADDDGLM